MRKLRHLSVLCALLLSIIVVGCTKDSESDIKPSEDAGIDPQSAIPDASSGDQFVLGKELSYKQAIKEARAAGQDSKWRRSAGLFTAALAKRPNQPSILGERGYAHYRNGQLSKAQADFRLAIAQTPKANVLGMLYYNLGLTYVRQGRLKEAHDAYRASLSNRSNRTVKRQLDMLNNIRVLKGPFLKPEKDMEPSQFTELGAAAEAPTTLFKKIGWKVSFPTSHGIGGATYLRIQHRDAGIDQYYELFSTQSGAFGVDNMGSVGKLLAMNTRGAVFRFTYDYSTSDRDYDSWNGSSGNVTVVCGAAAKSHTPKCVKITVRDGSGSTVGGGNKNPEPTSSTSETSQRALHFLPNGVLEIGTWRKEIETCKKERCRKKKVKYKGQDAFASGFYDLNFL